MKKCQQQISARRINWKQKTSATFTCEKAAKFASAKQMESRCHSITSGPPIIRAILLNKLPIFLAVQSQFTPRLSQLMLTFGFKSRQHYGSKRFHADSLQDRLVAVFHPSFALLGRLGKRVIRIYPTKLQGFWAALSHTIESVLSQFAEILVVYPIYIQLVFLPFFHSSFRQVTLLW